MHAAPLLLLATLAQTPRDSAVSHGTAYDVTGAGPPVVLIHGSNLDRRMWDGQMGELARHFRVIRYDLRAHGASPGATDPFAWHDDLRDLLDQLHITKAHVVGLSLGATIALDFALAYPDRVDRLVLAGPAVSGLAPVERLAFFGPIMEALRAGDYARASEVLAATPIMAAPPKDSAYVHRIVMENQRLWSARPDLVRPLTPPAIGRLASVRAATLIIVGGDDNRNIKAAGDTLKALVPGARLVVIPGANHLVNFWDRDGFNRAVIEFLK